jgi:hypothetical protein
MPGRGAWLTVMVVSVLSMATISGELPSGARIVNGPTTCVSGTGFNVEPPLYAATCR